MPNPNLNRTILAWWRWRPARDWRRSSGSLGAAELVMGGQTNNPSTQEILDAMQRVPTRNIILLPNNKNIILAAEQAARLATDQEVIVIPTRSMPQGISALLPYDPKGDLQSRCRSHAGGQRQRRSPAKITTATRSVEINGVDCRRRPDHRAGGWIAGGRGGQPERVWYEIFWTRCASTRAN